MKPRFKNLWLVLLCAAAAALAAFGITRWLTDCPPLHGVDELAWMQSEFHLSPAQLAAIKQLHKDYEPICRDHCHRIQAVRAALDSAGTTDPVAARAELARVETVCRDATRAHLHRVAAVMPTAEGARFLELVLPKLSAQNHEGPLGLK